MLAEAARTLIGDQIRFFTVPGRYAQDKKSALI